ncbi:aldo/keto reductase [Erythrobacter sp. THAF29]|uniref:aldo/keto reductase n=1 Tax=Erythrobacter sp. THAF29 TaxID=2587851 RepID=UPI0012AA79AF|nr:aldo/keto reductase [Erythrobacter sp. THAF29]QFT78852.1 putative oxidoreductase [Erythrobacter sp. THAF29]
MLNGMPRIGFGLWKIPQEETADCVVEAVRAGYRHFDSAADYANEEQTGEGLARAMSEGLAGREDLWVTSKLWNTFHAPEHVEEACRKSLSDLRLDYLDLYLVHFPIALRHVPIEKRYPPEWVYDPDAQNPRMERAAIPLHETWAAMEALVDSGLVKNIGVCNYNTALIHDLMSYARIKPAMLQIESHPYLTQERLIRLAGDYGIDVTAFSPLGAQSYFELDMASEGESLLKAAPVMVAADAHGKTPAQVLLRWGIQRGTAIIPKTTKPDRMRENLAIDDFKLSQVEMAAISALNQNRRFNDPGTFTEVAFNTFHPIYD